MIKVLGSASHSSRELGFLDGLVVGEALFGWCVDFERISFP